MNLVTVTSLEVNGILKLEVTRPIQMGRALQIQGQSEIWNFHITLLRLDELGVSLDNVLLPKVPQVINLENQLLFVDSGLKQSCYFEVTPKDQAILRMWLRKVEFIMERPLIDPKRVFHVTVSNAGGGDVHQSVGSPWNYLSHPI